jgi:probable HAF family extracellular repeat protein
MIEFIYSGSFDYVYYWPDAPPGHIAPGMPWTARLLFDSAAENQYPPEYLDRRIAVYQGISIELAIAHSRIEFPSVAINVGDNVELGFFASFADWFDVAAGPSAELYLSLSDQTSAAIHSTALPSSIDLANWPNRDIVFSPAGVYATGPIDRVTSRIVPEPAGLMLVGFGFSAIATFHRRRARCLASVAVLWLAAWSAPVHAAQPFFMGLGDLPGGTFNSYATAVSADGSVVVGTGNTASGTEAFRWTIDNGMVGLGASSSASDVSADGAVVVGRWGSQAFRWTQGTGIVGLGDFPGGLFSSTANAVSDDGSVIVGRGAREVCDRNGCRNIFPPFRWTQSSGLVLVVGIQSAMDISADGSVIVGGGSQAARWTEAGGGETLGDLPGGPISGFAWGVSADGSVIVGRSYSDAGPEAFRWTQGGGMVGLGIPPGFDSSWAMDASDGSVVVGVNNTPTSAEAFIWDTGHGMRSLRDVLVNDFGLGTSLTGWTLNTAEAISADRQFIVGSGINPSGNTEAWLARIEFEPELPGDFNHDGTVDAADYVVWRKTGGPPADYNTWRTHFGRTLAGGAGSSSHFPLPPSALDSAVPEPTSLATLLLALLLIPWRRNCAADASA